MATARATITLALRRYVRAIGMGQAPSSAQAAEALSMLNAWLSQLVGFGASPALQNLRIDGDYEVTAEWPGLRLLVTSSAAITITLPDGIDNEMQPADGFRLGVADVGNNAATNNITIARAGWLIAGAAANAVLNTNGANRLYMFRADLGDWKLAADLGLDDALPFPADFDEAVAAILGGRLAGGCGRSLSDDDKKLVTHGEQRLRARYLKPQPLLHEGAVANLGARRGLASTDYGRRWRRW